MRLRMHWHVVIDVDGLFARSGLRHVDRKRSIIRKIISLQIDMNMALISISEKDQLHKYDAVRLLSGVKINSIPLLCCGLFSSFAVCREGVTVTIGCVIK